ncbi:hypothetical protein, partial [Streptomyces sp. NPDC051909]|uniref:hypothetical protein n=1 Tax=Streptomyces sp. NPDC051909 TaxID=3154944 RepID=UPI0034437660
PQFWNINGAPEASVDWFHKYRVLGVVTTDPTGGDDPRTPSRHIPHGTGVRTAPHRTAPASGRRADTA